MGNIKAIEKSYKVLLAAGFATAAVPLNDYLKKENISTPLALIISGVLIVIGLGLMELLFGLLISKTRWIRKIIYGKEFIEGYWLDVVIDCSTKEVLCGGIILISNRDNEILLSGENYSIDGRFLGSFKTTMTKYQDFRLGYTYQIRSIEEDRFLADGCGTYDFCPKHGKVPETFTGCFFDTYNKRKLYTVEGSKLHQRSVSNLTDDAKIDLVTSYIQKRTLKQGYVTILNKSTHFPTDQVHSS